MIGELKYWLVLILVYVVLVVWLYPARAHEALTGWSYPTNCCSGVDCEKIPNRAVRELADGYHVNLKVGDHHFAIKPTTFLIPYGDPKLKRSPDGDFHLCMGQTMNLICFFAPPPGV